MRGIFGICVSALISLLEPTHALQFMLNTQEPFCIDVMPRSGNDDMTVTYTISGINEEQVEFTAEQNNVQLYATSNVRDATV